MAKNAMTRAGEELLPLQGEELLDRAEELVATIGENFFELGQILFEVKACETYKLRGFGSLAEWAEAKLGFRERKAEHYIEIWTKLYQRLGVSWEEVKHIGWTRLSRVVPLIENKRDGKKWLRLAEKHSKRELETLAKEERARRKQAKIDAGELPPGDFERVQHNTEDELEGALEGGGDSPYVDPGVLHHTEILEEDPETGETRPLHQFQIYLYPEQWSNAMAAMERAGQLTGSKKACHQMDLIATEFNTTYAETADGGVAHGLDRMVRLLERVFDVEIEVTVPKGSKLRKMSRLPEEPE